MLTLIRNVDTYTPEAIGRRDILLAGGQIVAMAAAIRLDSNLFITEIDGQGCIATPGLIDTLVHITGGGGEGGFATRTPEMNLSDATRGGVTTVVAALGTDATSRSLANLLAKAKALQEEGLSCFCYTGSYHYLPRTLLGSVTDDIMLIDPIIGVGELAIGDHRGSQLQPHELLRLASEARVGGMLSGKCGMVSIHLGENAQALDWLRDSVSASDLPLSQFYPTHVNRSAAVFAAGLRHARAGGYIDFTTSTTLELLNSGELDSAAALAQALAAGIDPALITMSSDGNASLPRFDEAGELVGMDVGQVSSLHQALVSAVRDHGVALSIALATVTRNPAQILKLNDRGQLAVGKRADLLLLDADSLTVRHLWGGGQPLVRDGQPCRLGMFEAGR